MGFVCQCPALLVGIGSHLIRDGNLGAIPDFCTWLGHSVQHVASSFIIYQVFMNRVHLGVLNSDGMSQLGGSAKTVSETVK